MAHGLSRVKRLTAGPLVRAIGGILQFLSNQEKCERQLDYYANLNTFHAWSALNIEMDYRREILRFMASAESSQASSSARRCSYTKQRTDTKETFIGEVVPLSEEPFYFTYTEAEQRHQQIQAVDERTTRQRARSQQRMSRCLNSPKQEYTRHRTVTICAANTQAAQIPKSGQPWCQHLPHHVKVHAGQARPRDNPAYRLPVNSSTRASAR